MHLESGRDRVRLKQTKGRDQRVISLVSCRLGESERETQMATERIVKICDNKESVMFAGAVSLARWISADQGGKGWAPAVKEAYSALKAAGVTGGYVVSNSYDVPESF